MLSLFSVKKSHGSCNLSANMHIRCIHVLCMMILTEKPPFKRSRPTFETLNGNFINKKKAVASATAFSSKIYVYTKISIFLSCIQKIVKTFPLVHAVYGLHVILKFHHDTTLPAIRQTCIHVTFSVRTYKVKFRSRRQFFLCLLR